MAMSICLAMIVKDESHVIRRCLDSVKPWISRWVICDTGSTDDTELVIIEALADVPGVILHHAWQDFAHNRTLAAQAALTMGCDYILIIDADEWLVVSDPHALENLTAASYVLNFHHEGTSFGRLGLFRCDLPWRWEGAIHEYPVADRDFASVFLPGVEYQTASDGARSQDPEKAAKEIETIETLIRQDEHNPRLWNFLAHAYKYANNLSRSLAAFEIRAEMEGGNADEQWYAVYQIGFLEMLRRNWDDAREAYQAATIMQPTRAEPYFWWGLGHVQRQEFEEALGPLKIAAGLPKPPTGHLIEDAVYDYAALVDYAVAAAMAKQPINARLAARQALALPDLPEEQRAGLERLLAEQS